MKYLIFYSWQSDLPNNTNRGFIEDVIEMSIKQMGKENLYDLEPTIDKDTKGVPGAPNITQALMDKIRASDAFVADISIVTGRSNENERPSPNPNVLLELGYAIALLGWERIVLFCNTYYGKDEDLPFDIRQHRRINYSLGPNDVKGDARDTLVKKFSRGLSELLEKGNAKTQKKLPILDISWNYFYLNSESDPELTNGKLSKELNLQRAQGSADVIAQIQEEMKSIDDITECLDPAWNASRTQFRKRAENFINEISSGLRQNKFAIYRNRLKICSVTLNVENQGNAPASDIRVELNFPEWISIFENIPSENEVPKKPNAPTPSTSSREIQEKPSSLKGKLTPLLSPEISQILFRASAERSHGCRLVEAERKIKFWATGLLHKHSIESEGDRFYLLAMPDAPLGKSKLAGRIFCSERDDWADFELYISVE